MTVQARDALGVLVLGAGKVSRAHAHAANVVDGVRLVGVADLNPERVAGFVEKHGGLGFTDYSEALDRDDVDIVLVGLPNDQHERVVVDSCAAGKHVFIEKPMAMSLDECDRMIEAAESADVRLLVAHSQRYYPATQLARQIIESGQLGEPVFATDTWYKSFGIEWRPSWFLDRTAGGGMWMMNGAHMVDRLAYVLGADSVVSVAASISSPIYEQQSDDSDMAFLTLSNGTSATIVHTGYRAGVEKCEVEVTCTGGMLRFNSYTNWVSVSTNGKYVPVEVSQGPDPDPYLGSFVSELSNLVAAVRGEEELLVPPQWGRHVVEVLLACEEASSLGRQVHLGGATVEEGVA